MINDDERPRGIVAYAQRLKDLPAAEGAEGQQKRPGLVATAMSQGKAAPQQAIAAPSMTQTSQPGIARLAMAGKSPLYTNIGEAGAQQTGGPESGLTVTPGIGSNASNRTPAPQNEGLARMAAANATRQSMIDAQATGGPEAGLTVTPGVGANPTGQPAAQAAPGGIGAGMPEGLARFARANEITQQLVDAQPRGGSAVLGGLDAMGRTKQEQENDARSARWRQDELIDQAKYRPQMAGLAGAAMEANAKRESDVLRQQGIAAGLGLQRRSQDIGRDTDAAKLGLMLRNQDMQASTAQDRLQTQERIADTRANAPQRLTLQQRRSNFEIDAARQRLADMDPAEIKRRTANYTATGRENPDFDPTLAKAQSLASRRMYGEDPDFDARQQPQPAEADDAQSRFKADKAMAGHTLGKQTERGTEVFDASGRLIGHYR